jgi:hypothetical protein
MEVSITSMNVGSITDTAISHGLTPAVSSAIVPYQFDAGKPGLMPSGTSFVSGEREISSKYARRLLRKSRFVP